VLVDHLVEGRHCIQTSAAWQCPNFSG